MNSLVFGAGAILVLLLSALDYLVTPENFPKFAGYRFVAASILASLYVLNRLKARRSLQLFLVVAGTIAVAGMVELMVLSFGGHQSPYYAGIIVFAIFLGFLPIFSLPWTISFALFTYAIYIIPLLVFDEITNLSAFYNNNIFLLSALFIGVLWRHYNDSVLQKDFSLEYDLSQDKKQLKEYSGRLEQMVEERTKELNRSELMLRSIIDNANDGIMILGRDGIILSLNDKACDMHGFDKGALIGTDIELLELEENRPAFRERRDRILNGEPLVFETQHSRKDGSKIALEISAKAIEVEGKTIIQSFYRDITERKKLEEQLRQSQKMESIGRLAGGVAHDFNNLLSCIIGYSEMALQRLPTENPAKEHIEIVKDSGVRAAALTRQLLAFSRKQILEMKVVNLTEIVQNMAKMLRRVIGEDVSLELNADPTVRNVKADAGQIEQVLLNLAVNARDAMSEGGRLIIEIDDVELDERYTARHEGVTPGSYVMLAVTDTGKGMSREVQEKIFEPFFTTKGMKGTGLGLSTVYGIVKQQGGYIYVYSEIGKGSTFKIYFPATSEAREQPVQKVEHAEPHGRETVLVVDDETYIRRLVVESLQTCGYQLLEASSGEEALKISDACGGTIDLLLTDVIMTGMNGRELSDALKARRPSIKVLFMSGYTDNIIAHHGILDTGQVIIQKPISTRVLAHKVREVLND
jgi:PAS domain S-box-containing protein